MKMNAALKVLFFFTDLILPLTVGYLLKKTKLKPKFFDQMMYWHILVLAPIMAVLSFWTISLDTELIWLPILGVIMQIVPGLIGYFRVKHKYDSPLDQGAYILSTMLVNRGVVGTLCLFILFGEEGYAYAQLVMLFSNVVLYMFCFPMARYFYQAGRGGEGESLSIKKILLNPKQIPVIGIFIGFILNWTGLQRPAVFDSSFEWMVHLSAWMSVLPIGYFMDFQEIKHFWKSTLDVFWIRFVATPLVVLLIALPFIKGLEALLSVVIISASPTAINAVITSKLNDLNMHLAMASLITTTAAYLLVIFPLIVILVEMVV